MKLKNITRLTIWKEPPFATMLIGLVITISTTWWHDKNWPMFLLWIIGEATICCASTWMLLRQSRVNKTIKAHKPSITFWRHECEKILAGLLVAQGKGDTREVELAEARFKIAVGRYRSEVEKAYAPYFEDGDP